MECGDVTPLLFLFPVFPVFLLRPLPCQRKKQKRCYITALHKRNKSGVKTPHCSIKTQRPRRELSLRGRSGSDNPFIQSHRCLVDLINTRRQASRTESPRRSLPACTTLA